MDVSKRTAALERLQPLVGEWRIEAMFSFAPEPTPGRVTFEWELGGQFLLERA